MYDPSQIVEFKGFAPDLDPSTPGIFLDTDNIVPTVKGFEPLPSMLQAYPPLPTGTCLGAYLARYLDGSIRIIAGTATKLYEGNNGAWTERGTGYTMAATDRWRFAMFNNTVIATNGVDAPQAATGAGGAFSALAGSPPVAKFVEAVNNFVFLANTASASNEYYHSGIGTSTVWAADIAAQSNNDTITETDGPFTAFKKLGPNAIAYKLRSMFLGQYVGPPIPWSFQLLSAETGTWGAESAVGFADSQFFVGWSDFWVTNGGRPQKLDTWLREWFFEESLNQNYGHRIIAVWDRTRDIIFVHYPSRDAAVAGTLDKWLAWHIKSNRWTRGDRTIEFALLPEIPFLGGMTYDGFGTTYSTYASPGSITYESFLFQALSQPGTALFLPDHALYTFTGAPGASSFLTGDWGNDTKFSHLIRVKPKFGRYPADDADVINYWRTNLGDTQTDGTAHALAQQGWYNVRRAARWHRFLYEFNGDYEIIGHQPILQQRGER